MLACAMNRAGSFSPRLCDVGLAASWLSTVLGPMAKLATVAAGVVSCRLVPTGGAALGVAAGITLGTSLRPGLGVSARLAWLATLAAACRGRRLPLLPVTLVGSPLLPSEKELPASGDGPREGLWLIAVDDLEVTYRLLDRLMERSNRDSNERAICLYFLGTQRKSFSIALSSP